VMVLLRIVSVVWFMLFTDSNGHECSVIADVVSGAKRQRRDGGTRVQPVAGSHFIHVASDGFQ